MSPNPIAKQGLVGLMLLSLGPLTLLADSRTPQITYLFPPGAQRGTTLEIVIGGQFLQEVSQAYVNRKGVSARVNKSTHAQVTATFSVAPNAELGTYEVHVATPHSVSNTLLFTVGSLKEIQESEPNNEISKANPVTLPLTINGKIDPGEDQDFFALRAEAGQRILFDLEASRCGSSLDASLTLFDKEGRELAFNEDFYTWDPFLDYTFASTGEYFICVRGMGGRGNAEYTYRLSIYSQPYLSYIFPLGGRRGETIRALISGRLLNNTVGLPLKLPVGSGRITPLAEGKISTPPSARIEQATAELRIQPDATPGATDIRLQRNDSLSNAVRFDVSDFPETLESEPNDKPSQANPITPPIIINGQLAHPKDNDYFKFFAKKGERFYFEVRAHRLGSPVDAVLTLFDGDGRELASNDDPVAPSFNEPADWDPKLSYLFKKDDEYLVQIRDITGQGGEGYYYRLLVRMAAPTFTLKVTPENPVVEQGKSENLAVSVVREEGFEGDVNLSILNLPAGVQASGPLKISAKETKTVVKLEADTDAHPISKPIKVMGHGTFEGHAIEKEAFAIIKLPRVSGQDVHRLSQRIVLSVIEQPPFALQVKPERLNLKQGETATVKVKATRGPGFVAAIRLSSVQLPKGIDVKAIDLPAGEDERELVIVATPDANKGNAQALVFAGTMEVMGRTVSEQAPAILLNVQ